MKYNTNVKHTTLEAFVTTVNKDEAAFNQYTAEYKNLEAFLGE